ncbi:MAG: RsmE family RNA methyltransferase [Rhabdochlamydiaceae bacterium]|nr:RsmE family RNA methyltransferase [Candidatus Amphrikana amoebophyrae]
MPHMRFYTSEPLKVCATVAISGEEAIHIRRVMRAQVGTKIELVNGKGVLGFGAVTYIDKREVQVEIESTESETKHEKWITLYQAMPKFTHLQIIVEKCTELGVDEIVLFESSLSEKKELSKNQRERLSHLSISALKQCGRLTLPIIREGKLHEAKGPNLYFGEIGGSTKISSSAIATFINGPEAGFDKKDFEKMNSLDAQGIVLSPNILRTETAAIIAIALLNQ